MTIEELRADSFWIEKYDWQELYVLINGKEHKIRDWIPECDQLNDPEYPNGRETCNHRIVFEI